MSVWVELHQFEYLMRENIRKQPVLSVDVFDVRYHGMLVGAAGRAVCELLREGTGYDVSVFAVKNEQVMGKRVPFIVINSDEPELTAKIAKLLSEYFTDEVKISAVPLMRFY